MGRVNVPHQSIRTDWINCYDEWMHASVQDPTLFGTIWIIIAIACRKLEGAKAQIEEDAKRLLSFFF